MSKIIIVNNSPDDVQIAIYFRPPGATLDPVVPPTPWHLEELGGTGAELSILLSDELTIFARYSADPDHPDQLTKQTPPLKFSETTASFVFRAAAGGAGEPELVQVFNDLVINECRVTNNYELGCEIAICQDIAPLLPPKVIWPGGTFIEDIRGRHSMAVVDQHDQGEKVVTLNETPIRLNARMVITGSKWKGYAIVEEPGAVDEVKPVGGG